MIKNSTVTPKKNSLVNNCLSTKTPAEKDQNILVNVDSFTKGKAPVMTVRRDCNKYTIQH